MLRKVFTKTIDGITTVLAVSEVGSMDADVTHPQADASEFITDDAIDVDVGYTFAGGTYTAPAPYQPTPEEVAARVQAAIVAATQLRLDSFAHTRNYDGILSACTYASSSIPKFAAEGQYCVDARDQTWATLYAILGEVLANTRPMPDSFADIAPELPTLEWPQ